MEAGLHLMEKNQQIVSYNGDLLIFQIPDSKRICEASEKYKLLFFRKRFDRVSQTFIEQSLGQYSFPGTKSGVELVCINCVTDSRTGLNLPCVLLKTCKKKSSGATKCTLLLFHASSEVECFLKFRLDVDRLQDLQICDGPAVLWRYQEKLCYISRFTSGILTSPLSLTAIQWVGTVDGEGTIIFGTTDLSFQVADNITTGLHLDGTLKGTEFVLYAVEKQSTIPGICFLPHAYSTVLRCLQVCMMQKGNDRYETSVAAVSSKQLIWIENGTPKEVCQLPFENPCKLQVASTSRGDLLFIISFASGDVCAVQKDGFKVAATWQQVYTVLIDDFLGKGADQILLLFKYEPNSSPDLQSFKLTDCCEINYPTGESNCNVGTSYEDGFQENRLLTIQALESRLQAGLLSLQELQQDLELKYRVLRSSAEALINMVQGKESAVPCADKEGLVSLWDDIKGSPCPPSTEMCSSLPDECPVERIWQRVVDDLLVIGVKLSSSAYLSLSNVSLSLILDQTTAQLSPVTKCRTLELKLAVAPLINSSTVYQGEPIAKKQRISSLTADAVLEDSSGRQSCSPYENDLGNTVTAVTELSPLLALINTSCVLLLHARRRNQPDSLVKSEMLTVPCGRISLSTEDILKGKHTVNIFEHCQGCIEDLLAVLSTYLKCSLHISSPDCTLTSVKLWMIGHMQGEPVRHIPEIICSHIPGSLDGTLFIWNPESPCEGKLTIFARNKAVLLQCLCSLKSVLPPTCVLNIVKQEGTHCLAESLALSLEEELLALRSAIFTSASDVEEDLTLRSKMQKKPSSTITPLYDTKEDVERYREELLIEQEQSKLGANITIKSDQYRQLIAKVAQIQMNSDRIAGKLATL
ncbi:hypothetical protein XENTR_v10005034 [Xenopus tropicalis]|uniref:FA complementation group B n=1 Tax=Xenopus tropicalis TaxID=8364 RepID=A0A6I8PQ04_XENTR|nr:Fanconi anemia group B protein isoform X1 [Xenopus tropicalis]XP_031751652.1 Fanconi anemia group B protein isoform X1 [Xenopus tropicalis]XP_031751653.1 Fanconi anemia group B protein isoform X1 [Xenopus tropicalis]KAE8621914.1 hypothetical protein XENTR_v10005034 [Xenopus tropicalis]KAE8621915.1 hypothetical protein XENTR_v10005034 [Xenopus tropicalis]KAE8621916.1 hypothetical protein XENTR_v10005034 [Xenopus tropicalis]KAE8621917.1 hypothetical protein XENTR_v10005034 [Xenopus tropicali